MRCLETDFFFPSVDEHLNGADEVEEQAAVQQRLAQLQTECMGRSERRHSFGSALGPQRSTGGQKPMDRELKQTPIPWLQAAAQPHKGGSRCPTSQSLWQGLMVFSNVISPSVLYILFD